jgi:hypothetical protein
VYIVLEDTAPPQAVLRDLGGQELAATFIENAQYFTQLRPQRNDTFFGGLGIALF